MGLIVNGFCKDVLKELPMEFAVEAQKLLGVSLEGSWLAMLEIKNLHARIGDAEILKGVSLTIPDGEVHAIMGPNGAGKSTLSYVLSGRAGYEVTARQALFAARTSWRWSRKTARPPACSLLCNIRWNFPVSARQFPRNSLNAHAPRARRGRAGRRRLAETARAADEAR